MERELMPNYEAEEFYRSLIPADLFEAALDNREVSWNKVVEEDQKKTRQARAARVLPRHETAGRT